MRHSYNGKDRGLSEGLAKRLHRHNPTARLIVEALTTFAEDIKDNKADWDGADSLTGMTSLATGGVKITGSLSTHAENAVQTTVNTDLANASPWLVGMVRWADNLDHDWRELTGIQADLTNRANGGNPGEVTFWRARVYRVHEFREKGGEGGTQVTLEPLGPPVDVDAGVYSTSSSTITFDFSYDGVGMRIGPPAERFLYEGSFTAGHYTVVMIYAMKGEGEAAGNVSWDVDGDNDEMTDGGSLLSGELLSTVEDQTSTESGLTVFDFDEDPGAGVPVFAITGGSFTAKTVAFTAAGAGNDIDIGVTPTAGRLLRVTAQGQTFNATLLYELHDGVDWFTVVDGDVIGVDNTDIGGSDLSSMVVQQTYDARVTLTPAAGSDVTPIVRRFGVSELTTQDLDELVIIGETSHELDPVTLVGNLPEIQLELLRDGLRDYRDAATDLLSDNYISALEFRLWMGHPNLARQDWLHIDDFVVDGQESAGPGIKLTCVSPLAASLTLIPAKSGTTRSPLVYANQTLKAVYSDILTTQILSFPGRRIGTVIEDTQTATKTITNPVKAKAELDRVAYLAGGGNISSQGRIKFVDMFGDAAPVAVFPASTIKMISVDPGYQDRIPDIAVGFGWDTTKENEFESERYSSVADALTNLGRALIDREENLDAEIAKWVEDATFAQTLGDRLTTNFAGGVGLFKFQSNDQFPQLEPGDMVAFESDQMVTKDVHTGLAVRGNRWMLGRICATRGLNRFTVWARSYEDILPTSATTTRDAFAATPQITGVEITFDELGEVVVSVSGDLNAADIYVTVGNGSAPSDPTVGSNDGTISGRTGSVSTGVKITTGNDAFVKVIAANLNADLGTVHSVKFRREIGLFHADYTTRSVTSTTNETTLETITIPADMLGTDGAIHVRAIIGKLASNSMTWRWYLGSTELDSRALTASPAQGQHHYDFIIAAKGSTGAQSMIGLVSTTVTDEVDTLSNTSIAEDSTADMDLTVTCELTDTGDFGRVFITIADLMGTL